MNIALTPNTETAALILAGDGYSLTIAPEAVARKSKLLGEASAIMIVGNNDESADAQFVSRRLAQMRIEVEKSRKEIKEPVNRIGKLIDATAADFLAELTAEETRIKKIVGDHAMRVAAEKARLEREEREAFALAKLAREAAEEAASLAWESEKISDVIAAKQAESDRLLSLAARMDASAELASTRIAQGVRFAIDFEVLDVKTLYEAHPNMVVMMPCRMDILAFLKRLDEAGEDIEAAGEACGLKVFKKAVISSR